MTPTKQDAKIENTEEKGEEKVIISKEQLHKLLSRIERLETAGDKAQLNRYDMLHKGEIGKEVFVREYDGKLVLGWSDMEKNICEKNPNGAFFEILKTKLFFENEKEQSVDYTTWHRNYKKVKCDVLSETTDSKREEVIYEVEVVDKDFEEHFGKKLKINAKFVN